VECGVDEIEDAKNYRILKFIYTAESFLLGLLPLLKRNWLEGEPPLTRRPVVYFYSLAYTWNESIPQR
jgi:hypothetical protein